ncbi:MAG: hypothetical protein ACI9RV_001089 [Glaciecola sp.]
MHWLNPRGSSSYGEDFGNTSHHNYPSNDYQNLMDVVDAVIAKGNINPKELFVTGGSGRGTLTACNSSQGLSVYSLSNTDLDSVLVKRLPQLSRKVNLTGLSVQFDVNDLNVNVGPKIGTW